MKRSTHVFCEILPPCRLKMCAVVYSRASFMSPVRHCASVRYNVCMSRPTVAGLSKQNHFFSSKSLLTFISTAVTIADYWGLRGPYVTMRRTFCYRANYFLRVKLCYMLCYISNTPFIRWSWLDELALRALVEPARRALDEPASSCKRGISSSTIVQYVVNSYGFNRRLDELMHEWMTVNICIGKRKVHFVCSLQNSDYFLQISC